MEMTTKQSQQAHFVKCCRGNYLSVEKKNRHQDEMIFGRYKIEGCFPPEKAHDERYIRLVE